MCGGVRREKFRRSSFTEDAGLVMRTFVGIPPCGGSPTDRQENFARRGIGESTSHSNVLARVLCLTIIPYQLGLYCESSTSITDSLHRCRNLPLLSRHNAVTVMSDSTPVNAVKTNGNKRETPADGTGISGLSPRPGSKKPRTVKNYGKLVSMLNDGTTPP